VELRITAVASFAAKVFDPFQNYFKICEKINDFAGTEAKTCDNNICIVQATRSCQWNTRYLCCRSCPALQSMYCMCHSN